jgi:predicted RNA-binding protein with PIN domain
MNVIGSRPDGWWRDRDGARRALAGRLASFARASGDEVAVVFDGREHELPGGVEAQFAGGGRGAADDAIVERVGADAEPGEITVVTSDRELKRRVEEAGACVMTAGRFLARVDSAERRA